MDTPRGTNGLHKPRKPLRRRIRRTLKRIRRPEAITLEEGLDKLAELLGLHDTRIDDPEERAAVTTVRPTEHHARSIYYAPDMDGQADPGEVIWVWIQPNLPGHPARERAMVVVGRSQHLLLGLLISPRLGLFLYFRHTAVDRFQIADLKLGIDNLLIAYGINTSVYMHDIGIVEAT